MSIGGERITLASLRDLLKRFCLERGLLVKEHERGMVYRMPNGTLLLLYAAPKMLFTPYRVVYYYGRLYRGGRSYMVLDGRAARKLYGKLKDAMTL